MNIFFGGAGWKLFYLLGILKCLQQNIKKEKFDEIKFHGASSGAWAAILLAINFDIDKTLDYWLKCAQNQRQRKGFFNKIDTEESLKGMFNMLNIDESTLDIIKKKVNIYVTCDFLNVKKMNNIKNKKDLYNILMGSTFIPLITSKKKIKHQGKILYDGCILELPFNPSKDIYFSTNNYGGKKKYDIYPSKFIPQYRFMFPCHKKYALKIYNMGYHDCYKLKDNPKFKDFIN